MVSKINDRLIDSFELEEIESLCNHFLNHNSITRICLQKLPIETLREMKSIVDTAYYERYK